MAAVGEAPTLFLRKATGLVKGWSKFDAFTYSFMSVNFVTLGLFFALSVLAFVPTGQVLPALLISGVFVTFLVITYAGLISVMPRAGGDYVWQSRVMGGGIAFVLAVTGWWFILWYWAPIYGNILNVEVLQPLAATFKWDGLSRLPGDRQRPVRRDPRDGGAGGLPGFARDGGLREGPEGLLLHRHDRPGRRVRRDVVRVPERVPERVQPGDREPVRRQGRRLPADDPARDDEQRGSRGPRPGVLTVLR